MKCISIRKLESIEDKCDVLEVTFDNGTNGLWIYDEADSYRFIGQDVIASLRKDMYHGELHNFVFNMRVPTMVSVIDAETPIKLFAATEDNNSNVSFSQVQPGEQLDNAILYCVDYSFKSSINAKWCELILRDKSMRITTARLFDYDTDKINLAGRYVCATLYNDPKYGFNVSLIYPVENLVCSENPDIAIAKDYIMKYFKEDTIARSFISQMDLISVLNNIVDYERGYGLVRLAIELSLCECLKNVSRDYDVRALSHAIIGSRACYTKPKSVLSDNILNVMLCNAVTWEKPSIVLTLLDGDSKEKPVEAEVYKDIKKMADTIIRTRKEIKKRERI